MGRAADRLLALSARRALALFVIADLLSIGMGMGVPIFCILLGAPVGWHAAARAAHRALPLDAVLRRALRTAAVTSGFTFLAMAVLWGRCLPLLFDPGADLANFGVPMILYQPRASFAGWLALMIFISPFLQFLVTLSACQVTLLRRRRGREEGAVGVRAERPGDEAAIHELNEQAFGQSVEADLIRRLRASCPACRSLVAVAGGRIVGHILFSPVSFERDRGEIRGMGLGPMAVRPEVQRRGIGSRLVMEGLAALRRSSCPFVVLVGHPDYYPRFGFEPASRHGIRSPWEGVPDEAFMVLVLDEEAMRGASGVVRYRPEFDETV